MPEEFYKNLKETGFIYGTSIDSILKKPISSFRLTNEEYTKINLFHYLIYTHQNYNPEATVEQGIVSIIKYYTLFENGKRSFFDRLKLPAKADHSLEQILSSRIQGTNTILRKNSASMLTYALLYIDTLGYAHFLEGKKQVKKFTQDLEATVINICFLALNAKKDKHKYDLLLLELFESSSNYLLTKAEHKNIRKIDDFVLLRDEPFLLKVYLLDLSCLAVWDDKELDYSEYKFLQDLCVVLGLSDEDLNNSITDLTGFAKRQSKHIKLFEYSKPVKQFYKQSTRTVGLLILRNKKRLLMELRESGELVILLGKSTHKDLTSIEKHKVKEQLLDICKTIPSLTIFLVPGGSLLLPLLIKLIPKLLPSAFQDNRIEE